MKNGMKGLVLLVIPFWLGCTQQIGESADMSASLAETPNVCKPCGPSPVKHARKTAAKRNKQHADGAWQAIKVETSHTEGMRGDMVATYYHTGR